VRAFKELRPLFGVSQSTVSRRITTLMLVLEEVLAGYIPTLEDLPDKAKLVVDGSLLTCWSWADAAASTPASTALPASMSRSSPTPAAACTSPSP
jgi:hypothetical protein